MIHSYRITKYFQYNSEGFLTSRAEEWTSFSDVEKGKGDFAEYLQVEMEYLSLIEAICHFLNVKELKITSLEAKKTK